MSAKANVRKVKKTQDKVEVKSEPSRRKSVKDVPLSLVCEWGTCCAAPMEDMRIFIDHVTLHLRQAAPNIKTLEEASQADDYRCEWRGCCKELLVDDDSEFNEESCGTFLHLARHVYYHCFHARLKCLGHAMLNQLSLPSCVGDCDHRNAIPELSDRLRCLWADCKEIQDNAELFYEHVRSHLDSLPIGNHPTERCKCLWEGCTMVVKSKHKMKDHLRTHTQEKLIACPTCGCLFVNTTKFLDHVKRNNNEIGCQYQCLHCKKKCSTARLLRDHMRHHVNQYKCPFCDMTCPGKSNLRVHIKYRHSDHRPYSCDKCSYSAKSESDLRRHEDNHRDDWICCSHSNCHYRTKFVWDMNKHYSSRHTETDPAMYACHLCGDRYRRGSRLTLHLRRKHQIKWPNSHLRFRYTRSEDGLFRLQTIRYETTELGAQATDNLESSAQSSEVSDQFNSALPALSTKSFAVNSAMSSSAIFVNNVESPSTIYVNSSVPPESVSINAGIQTCNSDVMDTSDVLAEILLDHSTAYTSSANNFVTISSGNLTTVSSGDLITFSSGQIIPISSGDLTSISSGDLTISLGACSETGQLVDGHFSRNETDGMIILHIGDEKYHMVDSEAGKSSSTSGEVSQVMDITGPDGLTYRVLGSIECMDQSAAILESARLALRESCGPLGASTEPGDVV